MDSYNIQITEPAEQDLYEIGIYISKELLEHKTAKKVISKIAKAISSLVADERLAYKGIRKIMMDNYIIFYVVNEKDKIVTIVRILYSRRDWISLL